MGRRGKFGCLVVAVLLLASAASAQLMVGENTQLTLSGDAAFGYNGVFSDGNNSQQVGFGGIFDLNGWFYNPKFLSFRFTPYYNQSRMNSNYNSLFTSKGLTSSANFFSGSHTPIDVSYERDWNTEGQFSLPGTPGYTTNGNSQAFSVGGGAFFQGWPTFQASYNVGTSNYDVVGSDQTGSSDFRGFNVGSTYTRWGFNFASNYARAHIHQTTPLLLDLNSVFDQNTDNDTFQTSVSRNIGSRANFSTTFSRTHFTTDYTGSLTDQTYNMVNSGISWRPTQKLMLNASANYTTNYGAFLLGTLLPPGSAAPLSASTTPDWLTRDSNFSAFSGHATYLLTNDVSIDGGADYNDQNYEGLNIKTEDVNGGIGYRHDLWGGQFAGHYGFIYYTSPTNEQTSIGNSAAVSYSHDVSGWRTTGAFQYNTNVMTAYLGLTQTGYSFTLNASHNVGSWFLTVGGRAGKLTVDGLQLADSLSQNYSVTVSRNRMSFNGSYSRSGGESLPSINGLVPTPIPGPIIVPDLLVAYSGSSYAFGAAFQPVHRLQLTTTYTHSLYETSHLNSLSNNLFTRLDSRVEYDFRQLHFLASYTYLRQGIGAGFAQPQVVNAIYFGVSRHIDIF